MNKQSKFVGMNGFSLIELMIGITLGLLIMTALVTLFVNTSRTNTEMAKVNSQIENGRFAMQLLQNEIVHGGFWGGYIPQFDDLTATGAPGDVPTAVPAPCQAYSPWSAAYVTNLLGIPVQAYDDVPTGCSAVVTNKKANTDVVLIRHAATCSLEWDSGSASWEPSSPNCEADTAGKLYFQASLCETDIAAGNLRAIVDDPDGDSAEYPLLKRGCTAGDFADKRKYVSHIYYIRDFAVTAGDGIPALVRSEFDESGGTLAHQTVQPLINGIEGFRVELGIDNISDDGADILTGRNPPVTGTVDPLLLYTAAVKWADPNNLISPQNRGDGSPDSYVRCPLSDVAADNTPPSTHPAATVCTAGQLANVVTVKIYVLARADVATPNYTDTKVYDLGTTTLGPFNDNFKRHVFSTTVRLNNVSSRRETP